MSTDLYVRSQVRPISRKISDRPWSLGWLLLGGLAACTHQAPVEREVIPNSPPPPESGLDQGAQIFTYTAPADGLFANSHYVVTKEGVVVFDTQFLPEYADKLYQDIRQHTKAPVVKIYITHPHPDHYFGAAMLIAKTHAELVSTASTAAHISAEGSSKKIFWNSVYSDRLPAELKVPELTFSGQQPGGVGGAVLMLSEVGINESSNSLIAWMPQNRALITGDLVFSGSHLRMAEGHVDEWIKALEGLKQYNAATIYPGHGAPGGPELIDANLRYLRTVQQIVARFVKKGQTELSSDLLEEIRKQVLTQFPALANPEFLDLTIPAEFTRQTALLK